MSEKLKRPSDFYISQSAAHKWHKVKKGEYCGKLFAHEVIEGKVDEEKTDSTPMKLGRYFEWVAIKNPNRDGSIPEAEVYKSNTKYGNKGDVKGDFKHAEVQGKRLMAALDFYGLKVVDKNVTIWNDAYKIKGTFDCVVQVPKERWTDFVCTMMQNGGLITNEDLHPKWEDCQWTVDGVTYQGCVVLDLKYSGLLDIPFKEHSFHLDQMMDNDKHKLQCLTYGFLSKLPFYYVVASSKDFNMRFIRTMFEPETLEGFAREMAAMRGQIVANMRSRFSVAPSMKHCGDCPLAEECDKKAIAPHVDVVYYPDWNIGNHY